MDKKNNIFLLQIVLFIFFPLCIILGGIAWFRANFEREAYQVDVQCDENIQVKDNFSELKKYLQVTGNNVSSKTGKNFFFDTSFFADNSKSTLILKSYPEDSRNEISKRLARWVKQGGHIIFALETVIYEGDINSWEDTDEREENFLMEEVDVEFAPQFISESNKKNTNDENENKLHTKLNNYSVILEIPRYYRSSFIANNRKEILKIKGKENDRAWALQYKMGKGKVTFLSSLKLWENNYLKSEDNAFFLSFLIANSSDEKKDIYLWSKAKVTSFWGLILDVFPYTILSSFFLLFSVLWACQKRLGQPIALIDKSYRSFFEHLDGVGKFHWRLDRARNIFARNREFVTNQENKHFVTKGKQLSDKEDNFLTAINSKRYSEQDFIEATKILQKKIKYKRI